MKINWTKEAMINLQQIEDYISSDNPNTAIRLIDKLISLANDLSNFPQKGRIVPELSIDRIREIIYKNYRLVYVIKKSSITILTVFESHKLLSKDDVEKV
ncbi:MAG: type II toxin-antitoxin system RelE/ParE family toxin [Ignavibacteriaceae bacterium]